MLHGDRYNGLTTMRPQRSLEHVKGLDITSAKHTTHISEGNPRFDMWLKKVRNVAEEGIQLRMLGLGWC